VDYGLILDKDRGLLQISKKAGIYGIILQREISWNMSTRPWTTGTVIPRSEKEGTKPPYVCPGCSNHTYSNNMITRFHVQ
jgi:hypothetical protein